MKLIVASLLVLVVRAQNDIMCKSPTTDLNTGNTINYADVCKSPEKCLVKCCLKDEVFVRIKKLDVHQCTRLDELDKFGLNASSLRPYMDFPDLKILRRNGTVSKNTFKDYRLVHSAQRTDPSCGRNTSTGKLFEDGTLNYTLPEEDEKYIGHSYHVCVEMVAFRGTSGATGHFYYYYISFKDIQSMIQKGLFVGISSLISSFFLVLTVVLYGSVKSVRDELQNMLLMTYLLFQAAMWTANAICLFHDYMHLNESNALCYFMGPIRYFIKISCYCWLHVLCFNIYNKFGHSDIKPKHSVRKGKIIFMYNALYALGVPAALTGLGAIADGLHRRGSLPKGLIAPVFGTCMNEMTQRYYSLPVLAVVMCTNLYMFPRTAYYVSKNRNKISDLDPSKKRANKNKDNINMFLRLLILMGLTWIFEVILMCTRDEEWTTLVYCLLSSPVTFSGFIIFITFICRNKQFLKKFAQAYDFSDEWSKRLHLPSTRTLNSTISRSTVSSRTSHAGVQDHPDPSREPDHAAPRVSQYIKNRIQFMDKNDLNAKRNTLNSSSALLESDL